MKNLTKKSILKLKPSSTLVINEKSKELIENGKKVYKFGFGQSPFLSLIHISEPTRH